MTKAFRQEARYGVMAVFELPDEAGELALELAADLMRGQTPEPEFATAFEIQSRRGAVPVP